LSNTVIRWIIDIAPEKNLGLFSEIHSVCLFIAKLPSCGSAVFHISHSSHSDYQLSIDTGLRHWQPVFDMEWKSVCD